MAEKTVLELDQGVAKDIPGRDAKVTLVSSKNTLAVDADGRKFETTGGTLTFEKGGVTTEVKYVGGQGFTWDGHSYVLHGQDGWYELWVMP